MPEYLFVYGTLRNSLLPKELTHLHDGLAYIGPGKVRGFLYDLGEYPGAVPDTNVDHIIHGEVHVIRSPASVFQTLDAYERFDPESPNQSLFIRREENICLGEHELVRGWVYWYNLPIGAARRIECGDYEGFCGNGSEKDQCD